MKEYEPVESTHTIRRRVSRHYETDTPYLWWTIWVRDGLHAVAQCQTYAEVTNITIGIRRARYRQDYFLEFSQGGVWRQCNFHTNEDFRSQFNADWAGKLLIVVTRCCYADEKTQNALRIWAQHRHTRLKPKARTDKKWISLLSSSCAPIMSFSQLSLIQERHVIGCVR